MRDPTDSPGSPGVVDPGRTFPVSLLLLGLVVLTSVAFGFLGHTVHESRYLVQYFGYYVIALTFAWAVVATVRVVPEWFRSWSYLSRAEWWAVAGGTVALTLIAVITVPYTYKVLYDEYVLQATAWCLHEGREVGVAVSGYEVGGIFSTLLTYLDKRPYFYAFIVSLVHDFTGYREANAFAVNTALMPVVIALIYLLARRLSTHLGAIGAMCAFGGFSLLAQNATGAGMEMLNLVMLLGVMHLAHWYLQAPDEKRLSALLLWTVLLAQTRYESSLYVAPVAVVVLEGWRRCGRTILPAAAILAPALLIPYALHNTYLSGTPLLWELREGEASRFGLQYLSENLNHARLFFFDFSGKLTNSWWLGVAGLPAAVYALWVGCRSLRRWKEAAPIEVVFFIFGGAITANLGLLMFYYWGQLDDAIVSRLSLPFCALLALCLAWVVTRFGEKLRRRVAWVVIGGALLAYFGSGLVGNAMHWTLNQQAREIEWERKQVRALPPMSRLILTNKSALIWLIDKIPAVQIVRARVRVEQIAFHMQHHTFGEVLVMQNYRPIGPQGDFQLEPYDRLPDSYVLEPIAERRFSTHLARISRLIRIDELSEAEEVTEDDDDSEVGAGEVSEASRVLRKGGSSS